MYALFIGPPAAYPVEEIVFIPQGATIAGTADILARQHVLSSPFIFSLIVRIGKGSVVAGSYLFPEKESVFSLAYRISYGATGLTPVKVTIPEGTNVRQSAILLKRTLGAFDADTFVKLATPDEGYLFPDTYFFLPAAKPEDVISQMKATFEKRVAPLKKEIQAFGKPESDVIIMASILEKEARQSDTRRIVVGILWKRLSLGMPLQVDAMFGYILGKDTYSPSLDDLKIDSPYNTYKYKGLPPTPIDNPGVEAIKDAVTPTKTPYLYYVTDKEGNIYYAKTFEEHLRNKIKAGS
ncbi:endolytic transglycosylase MltG [Candidatus Kaiserbacteria bacterium]|nr:endolytic transglycosylase MltG [Candidatus Kaiserbacteria bacterium]